MVLIWVIAINIDIKRAKISIWYLVTSVDFYQAT